MYILTFLCYFVMTILALSCGTNAEYKRLASSCQPTCKKQTPGPCPLPDTEVCICLPTYVRDDENECVLATSCGNQIHDILCLPVYRICGHYILF